jgi:hypothetical protein
MCAPGVSAFAKRSFLNFQVTITLNRQMMKGDSLLFLNSTVIGSYTVNDFNTEAPR